MVGRKLTQKPSLRLSWATWPALAKSNSSWFSAGRGVKSESDTATTRVEAGVTSGLVIVV